MLFLHCMQFQVTAPVPLLIDFRMITPLPPLYLSFAYLVVPKSLVKFKNRQCRPVESKKLIVTLPNSKIDENVTCQKG